MTDLGATFLDGFSCVRPSDKTSLADCRLQLHESLIGEWNDSRKFQQLRVC